MVFSSTVFLFIFLPITYLLCLIVPNVKLKNIFLIIASLTFYAFGEPVYVLLMLVSVIINYIGGRLLINERLNDKVVLAVAVVLNLGMLGVFKYAGFAVSSFNQLFQLSIPVPEIRLPIGISFFTFQALSYVIDVYRDRTLSQKSFSNVLLYVSFFPQLIAGPILKYHDVDKQIAGRKMTVELTASGIRRFIYGLSKKLLISNVAGAIADSIFGLAAPSITMPTAWLGAIAYCIQIYYDFSGYSDMAIGLGKMFGFEFLENFNYPYVSQSIKEFWRRWHISLSTWFKEYLYIPLGGNRKGKIRAGINRMIVFFCTGLWHGASWNFVIWGLFHGLFLMFEGYGIIPIEKVKFRPLRHIYTLLVVCVGFVFFRADTLGQAWTFIKAMFAGFGANSLQFGYFTEQLTPYSIFILVLAVIFAMPIKQKIEQTAVTETLSYVGSGVLLFLCILTLSSATYNPFIYFRF